jgi:segregation and condensation protein B
LTYRLIIPKIKAEKNFRVQTGGKRNRFLLDFPRINHIFDLVSGDIPNSRKTGNPQLDESSDESNFAEELTDPAELDLPEIEEILSGQGYSGGKKSPRRTDTNPDNKTKKEQPAEESAENPQFGIEDSLEMKQQRVEALLFLARKPQNLRKISDLAQLEDATQARTLIGQLNQKYDRAGRAFQIKQVAGGYQMLTRPQFSGWIERLDYLPRPLRLSQPAMETLTIVAYRQPIIKAEIEAIRGLACGEMLRQLLELNLIKIAGRSQKLGRPFLYITTKEFLTNFGLNSLQELPRQEQLSGTGLPDWPSSDNNFDQPKNGSSTPQKEETL